MAVRLEGGSMAAHLWCCCHPFKVVIKVLAVMVVSLVVLQYTVYEVVPFRGLFEARRLESFFAINSTLAHRHQPIVQHFVEHTMLPQMEQPDNITVTSNSTNQPLTSTLIPVSGRPLCPLIPPNLEGPIKVRKDPPPLEDLEKLFPMLELGGRYRPSRCQARDKVAVVIPYRDRVQHLSAFLLNMHPMLQRQQLDYGIFVVEQEGNGQFNRAMLMNVGFVEALKLYNFDCFIFHDVDLLPEDDRNLYTCPEQPRHMSVAVDIFKYRLPYADIFGGVSAMTRSQFQKVNGFSNSFWGWGGEDDDMSNRIKHYNYHISRYPANIARYKMLAHRKQHANPRRYDWLNTGHKRFKTDGINSLQYEIKELQLLRLYTRIFVKLATPS